MAEPEDPNERTVWFESFYCDGNNLIFNTPSRARLGRLRRQYRTVWHYRPDDRPYVFPEQRAIPVRSNVCPGPT